MIILIGVVRNDSQNYIRKATKREGKRVFEAVLSLQNSIFPTIVPVKFFIFDELQQKHDKKAADLLAQPGEAKRERQEVPIKSRDQSSRSIHAVQQQQSFALIVKSLFTPAN